jgi:hypothetical protein
MFGSLLPRNVDEWKVKYFFHGQEVFYDVIANCNYLHTQFQY